MMKLVSWNVNGIRSVARKGFLPWLKAASPQVVCLQETRAWPQQLDDELLAPTGYKSWWVCAEKKGYSGVGAYSQVEPDNVEEGLGLAEFDREGRVLTLRFADFTLVNAYFPNGQRDHARVPFKMEFCAAFLAYCRQRSARGENLILCGDFNTAHREIDLKRPRDNRNTTGFLLHERAWIDELIDGGYCDIFRHFNPEPDHYTWWSNRQGVRQRNIGWRIDYHFVAQSFIGQINHAYHLPQVMGSDHCPVVVELKNR